MQKLNVQVNEKWEEKNKNGNCQNNHHRLMNGKQAGQYKTDLLQGGSFMVLVCFPNTEIY